MGARFIAVTRAEVLWNTGQPTQMSERDVIGMGKGF